MVQKYFRVIVAIGVLLVTNVTFAQGPPPPPPPVAPIDGGLLGLLLLGAGYAVKKIHDHKKH